MRKKWILIIMINTHIFCNRMQRMQNTIFDTIFSDEIVKCIVWK